jgi:hypothetical protein
MKNISDVIKLFDLNVDTLQLSSNVDLLIDLNNNWFDADSYQITVNNIVREIDFNKVSKCGLVLFIDSTTSQVTVLSLNKNKSSFDLKYIDYGKILLKFQDGDEVCIVTEFKDSKSILFTRISHINTSKNNRIKETKFTNSNADKILTKELFYKELSSLKN